MFRTYPSNIPIGTSNNWILCWDAPRRLTARAFFRCLSYSPRLWRFWFSNAVDSTYDSGEAAYPDRPGGHWRILSARIGDGGVYVGGEMNQMPAVSNWKSVTFDGSDSRDVLPSERFWSDEVEFTLPQDHLLVWEWELEGNNIPATPNSQAPTFVKYEGAEWGFDLFCPQPDLVGAKREVKNRIVFWGDSITQGCGGRNNYYEHWAARVALALGENHSFWNIGLGWARGSDGAYNKAWQYKALQGDTVCLAFGVNDINSGRYMSTHGDSPQEIIKTMETLIRELKKNGIRVVLFTIPPFDYPGENYMVWKTLRYAYPAMARELDVELYDFSSVLDGSPPYGNAYVYGAHPEEEGCRLAAEAILKANLFE